MRDSRQRLKTVYYSDVKREEEFLWCMLELLHQ
jgi:hypothetical protein